jgi:hypothetical protein
MLLLTAESRREAWCSLLLASLGCLNVDQRDVGEVAGGGGTASQAQTPDPSEGGAAGSSAPGPFGASGSLGGPRPPLPGSAGNVGVGVGAGGNAGAAPMVPNPDPSDPIDPVIEPPPSNLATLVWSVGAEGTEPGFFDDARFLGSDTQGTIYVGEFEGEGPTRIQRFGADGRFLSQWFTPGDAIVTGLVATRQGTVFVLQGGTISRYTGATGAFQGDVLMPAGSASAEVIALAPDDGLVAVGPDQIVRFNPAGAVVSDVEGTVEPALDNAFFLSGGTLDGDGNLYLFETFVPAVYKFDPAGIFVDRIGTEGDGIGLLESEPESIAVDGRGRIYYVDFDGIEVLSASGASLGMIPSSGSAFGMRVTDQNELIVLDRNEARLIKYALAE